MNPLRFLPAAEAEFLHEVAYYTAVRAGTGQRFASAVEAAARLVRRHPLGGAPVEGDCRAMRVRGFPFSLIYRIGNSEVLVVAVAAHRRAAGYWQGRVPATG